MLTSCEEKGIKITKKEFGKQWPFTVDEGYIECLKNKEVIFKADGRTYGLNSEAIVSMNYTPIEQIQREDSLMKGTKMVLYPIQQKALQLCK